MDTCCWMRKLSMARCNIQCSLQLNQPQVCQHKKLWKWPLQRWRRQRRRHKKKTHPETRGGKDNLLLDMILMNMQTWQQLQTIHYLCVSDCGAKTYASILVYITHGEWDVGPRATTVPAGWTLVGCKWMFKVKHGSDGRVEPFKGSLIVKVYAQVWHRLQWDILTGMILLNPDTAGLCSAKQHANSSDGCCNGIS